jgi:hypothetical protein
MTAASSVSRDGSARSQAMVSGGPWAVSAAPGTMATTKPDRSIAARNAVDSPAARAAGTAAT